MRAPSENWFSQLEKSRSFWSTDDDNGKKNVFPDCTNGGTLNFPIFPWITPPVHPKIRSLMERLGVEDSFEAKEQIKFGQDDRIDRLVLLKSGLTARFFGSAFAQTRNAIAIAVPGRFACGNLNFFSHFPCLGHYYAIVPSTVISVPQELLYKICLQDQELLLLFSSQFELNNLSDRIGFGAHALLNVRDRFLMLLLTWAANFGTLTDKEGETWIEMPAPPRGEIVESIVMCSTSALENTIKECRESGDYIVKGAKALVRLELLRPIHSWIRMSEESTDFGSRDKLADLLRKPNFSL